MKKEISKQRKIDRYCDRFDSRELQLIHRDRKTAVVMADEKRGMFVEQKVIGWLVGKVHEIHDRYGKNETLHYLHDAFFSSTLHAFGISFIA